MQTQNGPSFYKCIGRTRRLSDFASPRRKLHDSAMCPPPQQSSRTGCAPGFEAQTRKPTCTVVLRPKPPKPSISTWPQRDFADVDACLDAFESFARARRILPSFVLVSPCTMWAIRDSAGFFRSLGPSLLALFPKPFT